MKEADVYPILTEIFEDIFFLEHIKLKPELTQDDIEGWDSQKQIEILLLTEERFNIRFKSTEIDNIRSVGDIVKLVVEKT